QRSAGRRVGRESRRGRPRQDRGGVRARGGHGVRRRMKLVTFDDGRVGELRGDRVIELDVPSMREYFERGAAAQPRGRELELAVVVKKAGKWFGAEEAADYVGGYVVFNDITARDIQRREMRSGVFSFCKGIDTFCPLGPWIVTPDEVGDPHDLHMELRVNG